MNKREREDKKIRSFNTIVSLDRGDCSRMFKLGAKAWLEEYFGIEIESYSTLWEEDLINTLDVAYSINYYAQWSENKEEK